MTPCDSSLYPLSLENQSFSKKSILDIQPSSFASFTEDNGRRQMRIYCHDVNSSLDVIMRRLYFFFDFNFGVQIRDGDGQHL